LGGSIGLIAISDNYMMFRVFRSDGAGLVTAGWLPEPPSYSAEFKTPDESYPPYTTQYATPYNYGGQHQNVVIVQPQVTALLASIQQHSVTSFTFYRAMHYSA